jgi:hypothetical protein
MSPPTHQLVNIFSPSPNDSHSGRATPNCVGGAATGRASALTVDSNATSNISFDTQGPPNTTIRPIPRQGSFVVTDPDGLATKKPSGRDRGSVSYSAVEHVAMLSVISQVPDALNWSESSPQWEEVYSWMYTQYYQAGGIQLSGALHGHFVDLYSSFKLGIRHLSVEDKDKKCPAMYIKGDDCCEEYVEALNNLLGSDAKKYNSRKWLSCGVVEMLLPMHIDYTSEFGTGQQTAGWLSDKATAHKTKFEVDQRNCLEELTKKRKAEEEERLEAAKNRKAVAEASAQLVAAFQQTSTPPAQVENIGQMVEQKIAIMKTKITQEIGAKMDENSKEVKDTLASFLYLLRGNAANRN